jgi:hypothetical protein
MSAAEQDVPGRSGGSSRKDSPATIRHADYVLIPLFAALTGYTEKAVRMKIEEGVWVEGREYRRAPDGHVQIYMPGYYRWVEKGRAA